ncbi:MAG: hypothetical protein EA397_10250 [Deltaproteobacteria bacterium]|nr:MAG: hypothetical protein EA397_10250 [Deltaproteobacteria bacterium]
MKVEVPHAEVIDKITILQLKITRLPSARARANARRELDALDAAWRDHDLPAWRGLPEAQELAQVNEALWQVEDALRQHEAAEDFGERFIALARSVYQLNDRRAQLKRQLNERLGSPLLEEKSYGGDGA